jgi:PKHD-type hydroxylase
VAILIRKAVSEAQLRAIRGITARGSYGPGSVTAVGPTERVKHNLQLPTGSDAANRAAEILAGALRESGGFMAATWIDAMTTPLFCRYETGMTYGDHVDAAMMGEPPMQMRCDIAVTVWLVDGASYDGGELLTDTDAAGQSAGGQPAGQAWKGDAGDCVIYAADTLHRVTPVTRGVREVAVFWIQTMIRDEWQRRILFDLLQVLERLQAGPNPGPEAETLRRIYHNLIRRWA